MIPTDDATQRARRMDVRAGYGASRWAGPGLMCKLIGPPGKGPIEGEVYECLLRGEAEEIWEHCKLDVVMTGSRGQT